jgi:hypothetical protein
MAVTINGSGQAIVQIKQSTLATRFTTTSTSYVDLTGLSVSITPTSASNRILVLVDVKGAAANSMGGAIQIVRNGTTIYVPATQGSRQSSSLASLYPHNYLAVYGGNAIYIDSPATTSAVTYKLQGRTNGATLSINASVDYTDGTDQVVSISSITVMEISGT